jgi:hypothetical protein
MQMSTHSSKEELHRVPQLDPFQEDLQAELGACSCPFPRNESKWILTMKFAKYMDTLRNTVLSSKCTP